ncbi:uncharacterized protein LOC119677214 [Teleopsis dalmanni]|uniref:uncharacterized protein LOC119673179 n=1 Tax=Teleopsis dalmanni TaxID=139649 RepID=UPI0018CE0B02|nr:uncharacterized protein LOC119673179 [Teleopsis dalmanni]XP_037944435.1 uncharacterized protein LOC119677214 [Teleopsis dalmanni]
MGSKVECQQRLSTECRDFYIYHKPQPLPTTRVNYYRKFYFRELVDQYMYSNIHPDLPDDFYINETEYYDRFCKGHDDPHALLKRQILKNKYPLYSTRAITTYNKSGDPRKEFKRCSSITKPVYMQSTKFG